MDTKSIVLGVLLIAVLIAACSTAPSVLKGTVIMKTETEAHINLGSVNGIQMGDTLSVWRDEQSPKGASRSYQVGTVKVIRFFDTTSAAVAIITGALREGDRVEKTAR
jgi:hypothetical protein